MNLLNALIAMQGSEALAAGEELSLAGGPRSEIS